jgi:hypothetical protein
VGALLDFMMDEFKALLLIGAATVRLWLIGGELRWLLIGVVGLFAAASGITLTSFIRRPEYLDATGARPPDPDAPPPPRSLVRRAVGVLEWTGQQVLRYPTYFILISLLDRLDVLVYAYVGAHVLYLGRTGLIVMVKLGRPVRARS